MAQLVAHLHGMQGVRGSSPLRSTTQNPVVLKQSGRVLLLNWVRNYPYYQDMKSLFKLIGIATVFAGILNLVGLSPAAAVGQTFTRSGCDSDGAVAVFQKQTDQGWVDVGKAEGRKRSAACDAGGSGMGSPYITVDLPMGTNTRWHIYDSGFAWEVFVDEMVVSEPGLIYNPFRGISSSTEVTDGPGYYISADLQGKIPGDHKSGFGWYSTLWPLLESPLSGFQLGLSSTWIVPDNQPNVDSIAQHLCDTSTNEVVKRMASKSTSGSYGYYLMQTLEGSLGWWAGEKYPTVYPKYQANATQNCYTTQLATPGWGFYDAKPTNRDETGLVQISNQLVLPPDGMTFEPSVDGEQLGTTWLSLPLPSFNHKYGDKAGSNAWTLFMKTGNFSGPVQFVAPQFWADGSVGNSVQSGLTLDQKSGSTTGLASEWNSIPFYEIKGADGKIYSKIPSIQLPGDSSQNLVFSRDFRAYSLSAVSTGVSKALSDGSALPVSISANDALQMLLRGASSAAYQHGEKIPELTTLLSTKTLNSGAGYGLEVGVTNSVKKVPQYFVSDGSNRTAISESLAPEALRNAKFKAPDVATFVYSAPTWWQASKAASETITTVLSDGSQVDYKWYKFVEQPALQRFELNDTEKLSLQAAAEKIQKEWAKTTLIDGPTSGSLANFDTGLLVTPPKGLELGYVPIVTKQYPSGKPATTPTPKPTTIGSPTPTPSASPSPITSKKVTIICVKGVSKKKVTAVKPKCPKGFKLKK